MTQEEGFTIENQAIILAVPTLILTLLCAWMVRRYFTSKQANEDPINIQSKRKTKLNPGSLTDSSRTKQTSVEKATAAQQQLRQKKRNNTQQSVDSQKSYSHPWLLTTLKAHTSPVLHLDFSSNKKYLASCAEDRTVMLWHVKDFSEKNHRVSRCNIEFDHACRVRWSPDSKAFVISRATNRDLEVYRVNKLADGNLGKAVSCQTFAQFHKGDIVGFGIASSGKFIMTCSADTKLAIWNHKGDILDSMDTRQVDVYFADVSPCGRFVASSGNQYIQESRRKEINLLFSILSVIGFTSDVKVWQVIFDKSGAFKELAKAFELKGHSAGVDSFAFNNDSSRMASVSRDKTWKFWDTNVEFEKGQEPHLLFTVNVSLQGPAKIALSFDARVVAIASGSIVRLYSTISGKEERNIDNDGQVQALTFDPFGNYLVVAVDKHIRLFHNVIGLRAAIQEMEEQRKKPSISQSLKQRMQQQISEAKAALQAIGEN